MKSIPLQSPESENKNASFVYKYKRQSVNVSSKKIS